MSIRFVFVEANPLTILTVVSKDMKRDREETNEKSFSKQESVKGVDA